MRYVNCMLCGSDDYKAVFKNDRDSFVKSFGSNGSSSQVVVCKSCGLVFQNPAFTQEELKNIYAVTYGGGKGVDLSYPDEKYIREKTYRAVDQIKWLERVLLSGWLGASSAGKRALEIGSSAGIFLDMLKKKGWTVEGVEPSRGFAEYAVNAYGIKVHNDFVEEVELGESSYDLIVLSHVLEHMPSPVAALAKLGLYLKPDGFLFVEVPNIKGIWRNLTEQLQSSHLFLPSVNTLRRLAAKAGLGVYKIQTHGRVIRCLLRRPQGDGGTAEGAAVFRRVNRDDYKILSLRLGLQRLSSRLLKRLSFTINFKEGIFSDTVIFTLSNYIATAFSFVSGFVIRRVLGPLTMGLYSELMLVLEYCRFHHFGILNALEREVPFYNGKKEFGRVEEIKKTTLAFITLSAINVGAVLYIASFFGGIHRAGLRFLVPVVLVETLVSFYEALLQSYQRFKMWSLLLVAIGFLETFLKVAFVVAFGLNGLIAAMALSGLIAVASYHIWGGARVDLKAKIYLRDVFHLLRLGIPLMLFRFMYLFSSSIDRLAIIFLLGRLQLGYYSIATMVSNYLTLLPKFSYRPIYPRFMEAFGKSENLEDVKKYLIIPNRVFTSFYSVMAGLTIITIPFFVTYLLPRFKEGIFAAQIIVFATFFSALVYTWNFLLIALYEQKRLALLYGASALISIAMNLFFIKALRMQINGVALATFASQLAFTTILICYGYRYYTKKPLQHLKLLSALYFPLLWVAAAMLEARFCYPRGVSFKDDLLGAAGGCVIFLILCAPLIYYVFRKEKLFGYLFKFAGGRG